MVTRRDFINAGLLAGFSASFGKTIRGEIMNQENVKTNADLIIINAKIATQNERRSFAEAVAVKDGKFIAVGKEREVMSFKGEKTQVINANKKTVIPGLNDSHMHPIRGGLNYNMELRWDGVSSLSDALAMLREQARNTPPPQWVRVVGGWTEFQFKEKRMPTLDEINAAAPDTPVFILHLYDRAFLNGAALRAVGYTKDTPNPPGGLIERDSQGNPTGLLIAKPNANILYSTLAKGPKLSFDDQINSTRHFMRELNRFGVTSVIDAGGGFQNYPDDYKVIEQLHKENQLTTRFAYNLFTQKPKEELQDFERWTKMLKPRQGDDFYRHNGAGEMLVFSAADFEDFLEPRPDLPAVMEDELYRVVRLLAENNWAFRLHATYDESITRALNVYEKVHREIPIDKLGWFIDHAETISDKNIERIKKLGGGIAIQHRMAYQGEYFVDRYGKAQTKRTPPIRRMLELGVPVGAGTDATRVASYNPFVSLYWLSTGRTIGGLQMYDESNRLDRMEALRLWTVGSSWFSNDSGKKGSIEVGQLADLVMLSADFFTIPEEQIKSLEAVLTVVGGKIVYAAEDYKQFSPPALPVSPSWSPVKTFGGYSNQQRSKTAQLQNHNHADCGHNHAILQPAKTEVKSSFDIFGNDWGFACGCAF
jgi:predicted amidohydrolase YtcJ